jgi:hypothetical protein
MVKQSLTLFSLLFLAFGAEGQVRVTLGPETTTTLPGVSPEIVVTLENVGSEETNIDPRFALRARPDEATEPFLVAGWDPEGGERFPWFDPKTLGPGQSAELYLVQNEAVSPWFCDPELSLPGEVRLQISTPQGDSNWITMVVVEPQGRDAEAWQAIKDHPRCYPFGAGETIWNGGYRDTSYAFFVQPPLDGMSPQEQITILEERISMRPDHPLSDYCRLLQARAYQTMAGRNVDARALEEALGNANAAAALLEPLTKSRDGHVRSDATKLLERNYTAESIQKQDRILFGPPSFEMSLACFSPTAKGFDAMFSYYRTKEPLDLPVGEKNKFTPPPFDRGQPTRFTNDFALLPWRLQYEGNEKQLVWHLNGENIKISAHEAEKAGLPPCPARDADTEEWWWDEMERRGY